MVRRSRLEIYFNILDTINRGVTKPTQIMYKTNLTWTVLQEMFDTLLKNNFIREELEKGKERYYVTEKGLNALGVSTTPAFILLKVSPIKRIQVYDKIKALSVSRAFRIAGEVDALIIVERENLDETLQKLYTIDGIQDTRSYVTIEVIK